MVTRTAVTPPTLDRMAEVLSAYGVRFDRTLAAAREAIGDRCDPADPAHAAALRSWLNKWICRIRVPRAGEDDPFVCELADWWVSIEPRFPDESVSLARLNDTQLDAIAAAYGTLEKRTAAVNKTGRTRTFGPTATAKVLYFVRPRAVTAWDKAISTHVPGRGVPAFLEHLVVCRTWAQALVAEAQRRGIPEDSIGASLGRPLSSVAKLIDEWLYRTITGGMDPT